MQRVEHPAKYADTPCFGLDYSRRSPTCKRCVLRQLCGNVLGHKIPLSQVVFDLMPPAIAPTDDLLQIESLSVRRSAVEDRYRRCYYAVFDGKWPESSHLGKEWRKVVENATAAKLSINSFIAITMSAWKLTHPKSPFYASNLLAVSSVNKAAKHAEMLKERYGHTGLEALGLFIDASTPQIEEQMLHSEIIAGQWIIGCKLNRDMPAIQSLLTQRELALDAHWLATENRYVEDILKPHVQNPGNESSAIRAHRERVLSTHGMLKHNRDLARTIFAVRSQVMPDAMSSVLKGVGHAPDHFVVTDEPVTDALKFWNTVALAVQHWECEKALRCEPHRLWR